MHADTGLSGLSGLINGAQATVKLKDTFTDINGTSLTAHTMDVGPGWTLEAGSPIVSGNQAAANANSHNGVFADAGAADVTLTCDLTWQGDAFFDLFLRWTDSTHNWTVEYQASNSTWTLYEINTSTTARASGVSAMTTGNTYSLQVVANGTSITFSIGGTQVLSYGSASFNQSVTKHGFEFYKAAAIPQSTLDNFKVTTP